MSTEPTGAPLPELDPDRATRATHPTGRAGTTNNPPNLATTEASVPDTPQHSVSVAGVVVHDDGRVLTVQRRDNQHWEPPGGVLELTETFEHGVRREIFEETGIEVHVERLTGVYKNMPRGIVALVFRCSPIGGQPTTTSETLSVRWLSIEEIRQHMDPAYAVRVTDAFTQGPSARVHDGVNLIRSLSQPEKVKCLDLPVQRCR